ncbi:hypothetical protein B2J88_00395 [Rhodococcus sp. SRB_17]|nr:hypothetical protein [Rhodococcus sp. SRB_17]
MYAALGYRPSERVSLNYKTPDSRFVSKLMSVGDLEPWEAPHDRDVWFGVNPISKAVTRGRGTDADITRVRVLFADLDIKHDSLQSLDECREVVDRLARAVGVLPTVVVESGHGLQPYWRLSSPRSSSTRIADERTEDDARWSRQIWREVYARWGGLVQQIVREVRPGAKIDNVYDLSRILRCPGSVNWKSDPVPVVTHVFPCSTAVRRDRLVHLLDLRDAEPLGGSVGPLATRVPTNMAEADEWIASQPGTDADFEEMVKLGRYRSMLDQLDYESTVRLFADGSDEDASAHSLMTRKVQHVVLLSTEGRAGLKLALLVIREAYLEVMKMRRSGEIPGEARSESAALQDFHRAVRGSAGIARTRGNAVEPQRDAEGRINFRYRTVNGQSA